MTWLPERARRDAFRPDTGGRGLFVLSAMGLALAVAGAWAAGFTTAVVTRTADIPVLPAATGVAEVPWAQRSEAAVTVVLPAWLELSALATNAVPWADLAEVWRHPDPESSPVEDFTLPVEHYDNGRIRATLHAGKAAIGKAGFLWAWRVRVELFDPLGAPDGRIEAENCLYDRNTRRGYCQDAVRLIRTNVTIQGTGLYWAMPAQRMQILSNLVMRLPPDTRRPGFGLSAAERALPRDGKKPVDTDAHRGESAK
ncbi:MAG: hypothetical protein ACOYOU_00330 [Kiritimatiellia bacterium]